MLLVLILKQLSLIS